MTEHRRRSRTAWSPPLSVAGVGEGHTHELSRSTRLMAKLLIFAVIALMVTVGLLTFYVYQQQQYIEGKGEQRDREKAEMNQRINDRFCELLALAPADSPQADYYREQLDCPQPGTPVDQLPPAIRQQYEASTPTVQPPAGVQRQTPELGSPAVVDPPRPTPNRPGPTTTPAPPTTPAPTPEPPPLVDLGPITDRVCEGLGVCL